MKQQMAKAFHSLSDVNRLTIVEALSKGETCGCTIIDKLPVSQPTMSYHLKLMTDNGLLTSFKEGTWKKHHLNTDMIATMIAYLNDLLKDSMECACD